MSKKRALISVSDKSGLTDFAKFLEEISHSLHAGSHALSGGLRRSVDQHDMVTGDIELF